VYGYRLNIHRNKEKYMAEQTGKEILKQNNYDVADFRDNNTCMYCVNHLYEADGIVKCKIAKNAHVSLGGKCNKWTE
jgi:hypothetical protein